MLVGRITKENSDESRVTVDFSAWLDAGEVVTQVSNQLVIQGAFGWNLTQPPWTAQPIPYDPTPITVAALGIITSGTQVQFLLNAGTPGMAYTFQFVAWGSTSKRKKTVEVGVQLTGVPPVPPTNNTNPTPLPGMLPLLGGVMLGPLYLFEDPLVPTEAANKDYVDTLFVSTVQDVANEAVARASADAVIQSTIGAEITRAVNAESSILAGLNASKQIVAGIGLNGGTIQVGGTAAVSGTFTSNYQAGNLTTFHAGLTLTSGTLIPDWNGGSVSAIGTGLTLSSGTIQVAGTVGTVETVVAGTGLSGGTITTSGTINANWNGGTVSHLASSLTISSGTLGVVFPTENWTAGTVTALGTGLSNSGGTLSSQAVGLFTAVVQQSGSRAYGPTYTNSTGKPMFVSAGGTSSSTFTTLSFSVGGVEVDNAESEASAGAVWVGGMVPAGQTYAITVLAGGASLDTWIETS